MLWFCSANLLAQNTKMPLTVKIEAGPSFNLLNEKVFLQNKINAGQQVGLNFKKGISSHFALGFEVQQRSFNFKNSVLETYQFVTNNAKSLSAFTDSKIYNGIVNLSYYKYNKSGKNLFEIGIGGGMQHQNLGTNYLEFDNPFKQGAKEVLFDAKETSISPIAQFSIQNTFFIGKRLGVSVGIKGQYEPNTFTITNRNAPPQIDQAQSFEAFCKTSTVTQTIANPINIIPTVGIVIQLGKVVKTKAVLTEATILPTKKAELFQDDSDKQPKGECFELQWENRPKKENCFVEEIIKIRIRGYKPNSTCAFEVYLAPYNDLSQQVLVNTITNMALTFEIGSSLIKPNIRYVLIVKKICGGKTIDCLQYFKPIERCNIVCLDGK